MEHTCEFWLRSVRVSLPDQELFDLFIGIRKTCGPHGNIFKDTKNLGTRTRWVAGHLFFATLAGQRLHSWSRKWPCKFAQQRRWDIFGWTRLLFFRAEQKGISKTKGWKLQTVVLLQNWIYKDDRFEGQDVSTFKLNRMMCYGEVPRDMQYHTLIASRHWLNYPGGKDFGTGWSRCLVRLKGHRNVRWQGDQRREPSIHP